jgi:branched-chain amino acid transport system substrate-binding protein
MDTASARYTVIFAACTDVGPIGPKIASLLNRQSFFRECIPFFLQRIKRDLIFLRGSIMIFRSTFFRCLILIFLVIGISDGVETVAASEPIIVGVLHSEKFTYATMMRNSHEMALEAINKEGGIKGRPLKLVYADDKGQRKPGEKAARELAKESGAVMLVGGYSSSNTLYTARVADKLEMPFLINTAADDRITQRKWINVYRMNPPAKEYAKGVEELLLKKIKPTSMAIVYENSPYGTGGGLRMMWFCRENDIEIRKIIPYHKERASPAYFQKLLGPLKEDPPDVIYMVSYLKDAAILVKKIRELNIKSLLIGGAGGFTSHKVMTMAGDAADNLLTATLWTPQLPYPGTKEYYSQYIKKYNVTPDYHGAEAYSVLLVAADVLRRAESFSPESIRAALDKTDIITPFGPVNFQSYGKFERQNSLPTMVLQIINDKFESVWPEEIATSKFISP